MPHNKRLQKAALSFLMGRGRRQPRLHFHCGAGDCCDILLGVSGAAGAASETRARSADVGEAYSNAPNSVIEWVVQDLTYVKIVATSCPHRPGGCDVIVRSPPCNFSEARLVSLARSPTTHGSSLALNTHWAGWQLVIPRETIDKVPAVPAETSNASTSVHVGPDAVLTSLQGAVSPNSMRISDMPPAVWMSCVTSVLPHITEIILHVPTRFEAQVTSASATPLALCSVLLQLERSNKATADGILIDMVR